MKLPRDIFRELLDYIESDELWSGKADQEGSLKLDFEFTSRDGHWFASGEALGNITYVDDSFTDEFGIYDCGHYELEDIITYTIDHVYYIDDDGEQHEAEP